MASRPSLQPKSNNERNERPFLSCFYFFSSPMEDTNSNTKIEGMVIGATQHGWQIDNSDCSSVGVELVRTFTEEEKQTFEKKYTLANFFCIPVDVFLIKHVPDDYFTDAAKKWITWDKPLNPGTFQLLKFGFDVNDWKPQKPLPPPTNF